MFQKLLVAAVLLIAVFNAAFGMDCSHINCEEGAKTLCAMEVSEKCYVSLRQCAMDRLTCAFQTVFAVVDDSLCADKSNMCF